MLLHESNIPSWHCSPCGVLSSRSRWHNVGTAHCCLCSFDGQVLGFTSSVHRRMYKHCFQVAGYGNTLRLGSEMVARDGKKGGPAMHDFPIETAGGIGGWGLGLRSRKPSGSIGTSERDQLRRPRDYRSLTEQSVLEISGTETLEELERRHRSKVAQAMANPFGWDAYVVVCAFCRQGHRIRFSHQRVE